MKNLKLPYILFFAITTSCFAQGKHSFDAESLGGYDYNYFKSPTAVDQDGTLFSGDQLISSSIYQAVMIDYHYRYMSKENRIRFSISPQARILYENYDDSYWSMTTSAKYDYNIGKNMEFLLEATFKRMNRNGLDGDQDVLVSPLGYYDYGAISGIQFSPFKDHETTLEGFYKFRNFDPYGVKDLQYNEYGLQFRSEQDFERNGLKHSFGIIGYAKKRLYDTYDASSSTVDGIRDWRYINAQVFYDYPIGENFEVTPSLEYLVRLDKSADRSGYRQYGPVLRMKFDNDRTKVRTTVEYVSRNYKSIEAMDSNGPKGELTQYRYTNFKLDVSQALGKNLFISAEAYSRIRTTNYTDIGARSFRAYRNQYAGIGLKMEL